MDTSAQRSYFKTLWLIEEYNRIASCKLVILDWVSKVTRDCLGSCFATHYDWLRTLSPPSQPVRLKTCAFPHSIRCSCLVLNFYWPRMVFTSVLIGFRVFFVFVFLFYYFHAAQSKYTLERKPYKNRLLVLKNTMKVKLNLKERIWVGLAKTDTTKIILSYVLYTRTLTFLQVKLSVTFIGREIGRGKNIAYWQIFLEYCNFEGVDCASRFYIKYLISYGKCNKMRIWMYSFLLLSRIMRMRRICKKDIDSKIRDLQWCGTNLFRGLLGQKWSQRNKILIEYFVYLLDKWKVGHFAMNII